MIARTALKDTAVLEKYKSQHAEAREREGRLLDFFDIETKLVKRWEGGPTEE